MPQCPIEQAQTRVIAIIAERGVDAPALLHPAYSNDEIVQAAMKSMVFNSTHGAIVRSVVIKTIGMCGDIEDSINVLLPLLDSTRAKNRAKYTSHTNFGNEKIEYVPDKNTIVRENVLLAIAAIVHRQNSKMKKPIAWDLGNAMVACILLDPSKQVRNTAAYLLGAKGTKEAISLLLGHIGNAESARDEELYARGESAIKTIVEVMKKGRVRGTFLTVLLNLSTKGQEGNRLWELAEKSLLEIYNAHPNMQKSILKHVIVENTKLNGISDRDLFGKRELVIKRYGRLLIEMGMSKEAVEGFEKKLKPTKSMRPPRKMRGRALAPNPEAPHIARGPVVDHILNAGRAIKQVFARDPRK